MKTKQPGGRIEIHTATVQGQKTWLQEYGHFSEVDELRCVTRLYWKLMVCSTSPQNRKKWCDPKSDSGQKSVGVLSTVCRGLQGRLPPRNNSKTMKNENVGFIYLSAFFWFFSLFFLPLFNFFFLAQLTRPYGLLAELYINQHKYCSVNRPHGLLYGLPAQTRGRLRFTTNSR